MKTKLSSTRRNRVLMAQTLSFLVALTMPLFAVRLNAQTGEAGDGAKPEPLGSATYTKHNGIIFPDQRFTPGIVATTDKDKIVSTAWGEDERHVTAKMKKQVCLTYGIRSGCPGKQYELDHRIPRCAGGADDIRNLWPQPYPQAKWKDRLEDEICRGLKAGTVSVEEAQKLFLGDWSGRIIPRVAQLHITRECMVSAGLTPKSDCKGPDIAHMICSGMTLNLAGDDCGTIEVNPTQGDVGE